MRKTKEDGLVWIGLNGPGEATMRDHVAAELRVRPGNILMGKYRIERVLGQGGMGVVVAARHLQLEELFAIKYLLPEALDEDLALDRFLREARAAAQLKGEHLVKVVDVGELEDGAPYMVMEYLEGSDLRSLIDEHKQRGDYAMPVEEALLYVIHTCEALVEAHAAGIIHRDIKPSNLFLTRRSNGHPCVKVLDFGISKHTGGRNLAQTKTGTIFGSPYYMSPEQMTNAREVDPKTDIWSLGVVFYELLTGLLPFPGRSMTEIVAKVLQDDPIPPSVYRPCIPPAFDSIAMTCLRKRREERFRSMAELLEAIQGLLSDEWVRASALGKAEGFSGLLNASRASLPLISVQPPAISAAVPVLLPAESEPSNKSNPAQMTVAPWGKTRPSAGAGRKKLGFLSGLGVVVAAGLGVGCWVLFQKWQHEETPLVALHGAAPFEALPTITSGAKIEPSVELASALDGGEQVPVEDAPDASAASIPAKPAPKQKQTNPLVKPASIPVVSTPTLTESPPPPVPKNKRPTIY